MLYRRDPSLPEAAANAEKKKVGFVLLISSMAVEGGKETVGKYWTR
jgi:hypothetical protein